MSRRCQSQLELSIPTWSLHVSGGVLGLKAPKTSGESSISDRTGGEERVLHWLLHIFRSRSYVRPDKKFSSM